MRKVFSPFIHLFTLCFYWWSTFANNKLKGHVLFGVSYKKRVNIFLKDCFFSPSIFRIKKCLYISKNKKIFFLQIMVYRSKKKTRKETFDENKCPNVIPIFLIVISGRFRQESSRRANKYAFIACINFASSTSIRYGVCEFITRCPPLARSVALALFRLVLRLLVLCMEFIIKL